MGAKYCFGATGNKKGTKRAVDIVIGKNTKNKNNTVAVS
jgi:hypothetical protein